MENASLAKRWLALAAGAFCCWALMFVALPAVGRAFPAMARLGAVAEERNIRTGMFFYTDVEVAGVSIVNMENTLRFLPRGGRKAPAD